MLEIKKEIMVKKFNKQNAGITLIALIITIIVLLILAGVSIAMLTGNNGILTQAKLAKENSQIAKEEEEKRLKSNNDYINEQLENVIPGKIVKETKKNNYVDKNGDKATIPAGFTVSKIEEEQNIADGLVIYDIPESDISTVDWSTKNDDGVYNIQTLYNQFVWIPVVNENSYKRDFNYPGYYLINDIWTLLENGITDCTITDTEYLPDALQPLSDSSIENENAEKKAVLKYLGFYVSRYETGNINNAIAFRQNCRVLINKTKAEYKSIAKTAYNGSSVYSAMCSGIQWDVMMHFVDGKSDGNHNAFNPKKYSNLRHTGNLANTGKNINDKVQNIYDLEGNCFEWVSELYSSNKNNTVRGGRIL